MKKKFIIYIMIISMVFVASVSSMLMGKDNKEIKTNKMTATILTKNGSELTLQDSNNIIYTFSTDIDELGFDVGSNIIIEYTGLLDKNQSKQVNKIIKYKTKDVMKDENGIPTDWLDDGIFSKFYILANKKLEKMTLDEKIAQLLLVRYPDTNQKNILEANQFGGYVFFEKDFRNKTKDEVKKMINSLQDVSKIPILTAVDEEGGSVVRVSSNSNLASSKFKSPKELYDEGGFDLIASDTKKKSELLSDLGLNLNLAPVVDVSTDPDDYMYDRTIGENTEITSKYAKTVIDASKGGKVSYTLKHFPGYGNNSDTHDGASTDNRTLEDIKNNDIPPFKAGIEAGAEAVLVSHNTVTNIDSSNPASLSPSVHNMLRNDLGFTGIIITDDLAMGATSSISNNAVKAILAGNDLIITTNYGESINSIKDAITDGTIGENLIDKLAFRVLAWKYYKGLMFEIHK